ncbi:MAG: hypothetical protein ACREXO_13715, partial [Advenella sp.]
ASVGELPPSSIIAISAPGGYVNNCKYYIDALLTTGSYESRLSLILGMNLNICLFHAKFFIFLILPDNLPHNWGGRGVTFLIVAPSDCFCDLAVFLPLVYLFLTNLEVHSRKAASSLPTSSLISLTVSCASVCCLLMAVSCSWRSSDRFVLLPRRCRPVAANISAAALESRQHAR